MRALEEADPTLETPELTDAFERVDPVSVDRAILERASEVYVTPLDAEWADLGSWDSLGRVLEAEGDAVDAEGFVAIDGSDVLALESGDTVVASPDAHVSLIGVEDLVVAAYGDRILVAAREEAGRVRDVVDRLDE